MPSVRQASPEVRDQAPGPALGLELDAWICSDEGGENELWLPVTHLCLPSFLRGAAILWLPTVAAAWPPESFSFCRNVDQRLRTLPAAGPPLCFSGSFPVFGLEPRPPHGIASCSCVGGFGQEAGC